MDLKYVLYAIGGWFLWRCWKDKQDAKALGLYGQPGGGVSVHKLPERRLAPGQARPEGVPAFAWEGWEAHTALPDYTQYEAPAKRKRMARQGGQRHRLMKLRR